MGQAVRKSRPTTGRIVGYSDKRSGNSKRIIQKQGVELWDLHRESVPARHHKADKSHMYRQGNPRPVQSIKRRRARRRKVYLYRTISGLPASSSFSSGRTAARCSSREIVCISRRPAHSRSLPPARYSRGCWKIPIRMLSRRWSISSITIGFMRLAPRRSRRRMPCWINRSMMSGGSADPAFKKM